MIPETHSPSKTLPVCLIGGTGLVGSESISQLCTNPEVSKIFSISRRPLSLQSEKICERIIENFKKSLAHSIETLPCPSTLIWTLGTTLKQAGSKEKFREIDHDLAIIAATTAKKLGVKKFILVSAAGANHKSSIFYNKTKGEVKQEISRLCFDSLLILRPSLILGSRSESRPGENFAQFLLQPFRSFFSGPLSSLRPVHYKDIAKTIIILVNANLSGKYLIHSKQIQDIAQSGKIQIHPIS